MQGAMVCQRAACSSTAATTATAWTGYCRRSRRAGGRKAAPSAAKLVSAIARLGAAEMLYKTADCHSYVRCKPCNESSRAWGLARRW